MCPMKGNNHLQKISTNITYTTQYNCNVAIQFDTTQCAQMMAMYIVLYDYKLLQVQMPLQ